MRISKSDRKFLAWEGLLSIILFMLSLVAIIICRFALNSDIMTYGSVGVCGYFLGNGVAYLKISNIK